VKVRGDDLTDGGWRHSESTCEVSVGGGAVSQQAGSGVVFRSEGGVGEPV
jgi:hypothetical protein